MYMCGAYALYIIYLYNCFIYTHICTYTHIHICVLLEFYLLGKDINSIYLLPKVPMTTQGTDFTEIHQGTIDYIRLSHRAMGESFQAKGYV